jgi:hypothetical protein
MRQRRRGRLYTAFRCDFQGAFERKLNFPRGFFFTRPRLEAGALEDIAKVIESEIFVRFAAKNFRGELFRPGRRFFILAN